MAIRNRTKIHAKDKAKLVKEGEKLEAFALSLGATGYLAIAVFGKLYLKSDNFIIYTFVS